MRGLKIKVCGMREAENIQALLGLPIDYIGFIFYEKSARYVHQKLWVSDAVGKVGVFVNAEQGFILEKINAFGLNVLQLHGDESPEWVENLKKNISQEIQIIKAFSVRGRIDFSQFMDYQYCTDYFLFDTYSAQKGGSGKQFHWNLLREYPLQQPYFLAGGISANDADEILHLDLPHLYAIDLNSKFELRPAYKNIPLLTEFIYKIKNDQA